MNCKELNDFIKDNQPKLDTKFRQKYHFMAPIGWINDPNGFVYHNGEYHLFYQFNPYCQIHTDFRVGWGHAVSKDLIHYEDRPVPLWPDDKGPDKDGVWSGSSIFLGNRHFVFYAGQAMNDGVQHQCLCLAYSDDGVNYVKYEKNPIIDFDENYPHCSCVDFRDPYVVKRENDYLMVIGTKKDNHSRIVAFTSTDLYNWEFLSVFYENNSLGLVFECPALSDEHYFILSPVRVPPKGNEYWNMSSCLCMNGKIVDSVYKVDEKNIFEIDHGLEFYAPQTCIKDGKVILISWMQMWGRQYFLKDNGYGYEGCMTIPRILSYKDGHLYQTPTEDVYNLFGNERHIKLSKDSQTIKCTSLLKLKLEESNSIRFGNSDHYIEFIYDKEKDTLYVDRTHSRIKYGGWDDSDAKEGKRQVFCHSKEGVNLEIFLDRISLEVFINDGIESMSNIFHFDELNLSISSEKEIQATLKDF